MRVYILTLVIVGLAVYAWRNWFISLCGLIVLAAMMGFDDMPRQVLGIHGMNPWNLLLVAILVPWFVTRRYQRIRWDMPRAAAALVGTYVCVIVVAYVRAALDIKSFPPGASGEASTPVTMASLTGDHLVNALKYLIPALLLFDGARTRRRLAIGLVATLVMALPPAATIVKVVPIASLQQTGKEELRARRRIGKRLGYHANGAAMICATGAWGILAAAGLRRRRWQAAAIAALALLPLMALVLTRSRGGYLAFAGVGCLFAVFLWRYLLVVLPVGLLVLFAVFPGVSQRLLAGVGVVSVEGRIEDDFGTITAGRTTVIWPPVLDTIATRPALGYGRLSILRTSARDRILEQQDVCPTHPHNAYLELVADTGVIGAVPVLALLVGVFWISLRLARYRRDRLLRAVGAAALAAVTIMLLMGLSGQTFFPKENAQIAWCLFGLSLRAWVMRGSALRADAMRASVAQGPALTTARHHGRPPARRVPPTRPQRPAPV